MSVWDSYPPDYRSAEIQQILRAARAGECCALIGLSGAGKTNLLSFLVHRVQEDVEFVFLDCNFLASATENGFWQLLAGWLGCAIDFQTIDLSLGAYLASPMKKLCLVIDRFDALSPTVQSALAGGLRALRDHYKYQLSYAIGMRRPMESFNEMTELFSARTIWLGPLVRSDAEWSIHHYAARHGLKWDAETVDQIFELCRGYPSLLRAVCEAHAQGTPLDLKELRASEPIRNLVDEFWQDNPSPEALNRCGLARHELLVQARMPNQDESLTAKEHLLLLALRSHAGQIFEKDDLIRAVWPEDQVFLEGIRDDSLAQLVRRLRKKVGAGQIETIPGRGYRWRGI